MPRPGLRSRSVKRVKVRTPGGKTVTHYRSKKTGKPQCADCGKVLPGVPRESRAKMRNMPKTAKRPERPFGGVLCSPCSRKKIIAEVRAE